MVLLALEEHPVTLATQELKAPKARRAPVEQLVCRVQRAAQALLVELARPAPLGWTDLPEIGETQELLVAVVLPAHRAKQDLSVCQGQTAGTVGGESMEWTVLLDRRVLLEPME